MKKMLAISAAAALCLAPAALAGDCEGDVSGDGIVDFTDIIEVILDYGCEADCSGDADGNGAVDFNDLILVVSNYGCGIAGCESDADCDDGDDTTIDICMPWGCINIPTK